MPICSCEEAGCGLLGGRNVDLRTQKQHMRVDQLAQFHRTRALSQPAFSEQHEEIMQWFASLALSDESMAGPQSLGRDQLWNELEPGAGHLRDLWQDPSPSIRSIGGPTQRLLQRLSDIDAKTNTLDDDANSLIAEINLLGVDGD